MMLRDVTGEDDNAEDDHEKDDNVDAIRRNCAIEMHVNMSQETSEEPLQTEIYRQKAADQIDQNADTHFARACAVEMHFNISRKHLYAEIYRKNGAPQNRGADFVRACAVEIHVNISQEPLYTEIYSKKARAQSEHPDQAPAFTITVRTTQCGHTACGNFNGKTDKNLLDLPGLLWANPPFSAQRLQGFTDEPPQCQECKKLPIF